MAKKRKPKALTKGQLVRAKARATIGQPKATQVHHKFKPKTKRGMRHDEAFENADDYIHMSQPKESYVEGAPFLARAPERANVPVVMKQRQTRNTQAVPTQFSPEVIAHCNILRRTEGEEAVKRYLSTLTGRSENNMSSPTHFDMAEQLRQQREQQTQQTSATIASGSVESLLADAKKKINYFEAEVARNQMEVEKYRNVVLALQTALDLVTGKITSVKSPATAQQVDPAATQPRYTSGARAEMKPKGYWNTRVPEALLELGPDHSRSELIKYMVDRGESTYGAVDQAIRTALKKDLIFDIDGKFVHPDWIEGSNT